MALAADQPWPEIAFGQIARALGMSMEALEAHAVDKDGILALLGQAIDRRMENAAPPDLADGSIKDRLFELVMARLDAMRPWRAGLAAVVEALMRDPLAAARQRAAFARSMEKILMMAGADLTPPWGGLKIAGLSLLYVKILKTWAADQTGDEGMTMAALDRDLSRAETLMRRFSRHP